MHFDFRLEHDGVLLSWAIPRGPSLDPAKKRLAVQTEDHPIDYGEFEGVIPSGYGAGTVMLWDIGRYEWVKESADDFEASRRRGDIKFQVHGTKICGEFALIHIGERGRQYGGSGDGDKNWLAIKKRDACVVEGFEAIDLDVSVKTGRSLAQIASDGGGDPREMKRAARVRTAPPVTHTDIAPSEPAPAPPSMLATPVSAAFSRDGWLFELKYDGIRAMVSVAGDAVRITGRRGGDETAHYPEAQTIRAGICARQAIVDGELVVLDPKGRPSFERIQQRINVVRGPDVRRVAAEHPVTFIAFDLLELEGRDMLSTELRIRKKTLRETIVDSPNLLFAEHVERDGIALFEQARASVLRASSASGPTRVYRPGVRSPDWVKVKSWLSQSCVIVGYTAGRGKRSNQIGALILAVVDGTRLIHCGQVGTGFDEKTLRDLQQRLRPLEITTSALEQPPKTSEPATWVQPELVCEVRFAGWNCDGILRHPAFGTLRPDQRPEDAVRETARPPSDEAATRRHHRAGRQISGAKSAATVTPREARSPTPSGWRLGGQRRRSVGRRGCVATQPSRQTKGDPTRRRGGAPKATGPGRERGSDHATTASGRECGTGHAQNTARQRTLGHRGPQTPAHQLGQGPLAGRRDHEARHDRVLRPDGPVHAAVPARPSALDAGVSRRHRWQILWRKDKPAMLRHGSRRGRTTARRPRRTSSSTRSRRSRGLQMRESSTCIRGTRASTPLISRTGPYSTSIPSNLRRSGTLSTSPSSSRRRWIITACTASSRRADRRACRSMSRCVVAPITRPSGTGSRTSVVRSMRCAGTRQLGVGRRQADRSNPHRLHAEHHQQDARGSLFVASCPGRTSVDFHLLGRA